MQIDEYRKLRELEDTYWWFVARRELAVRLVARHSDPGIALDMGCGTGAVLTELVSRGPAVGIDVSPVALKFCQERGLEGLVAGDAEALPFQSNSFQAVVALDVLEHVKNDPLAIREVARVLRPGGVLVLNVPAFKSLWGPHDVALHHYRRYRAGEVQRLMEASGLSVEVLSYGVFFLFPIVLLVRLLERFRRGEAQVRLPSVPSWANRGLISLQRVEARLMERVPLPWGSSIVAVARKIH